MINKLSNFIRTFFTKPTPTLYEELEEILTLENEVVEPEVVEPVVEEKPKKVRKPKTPKEVKEPKVKKTK